MAKLIPRHMEIIKEIDRRVAATPFIYLVHLKYYMVPE